MEKNILLKIPEALLTEDGEECLKIAHLLVEGILFTNNGHWDSNWTKDKTTLHVSCNDLFAWGCADAEDILHSEISELYSMYRKDPIWGASAWCIKKRNLMPQSPVEKKMRESGVWNDLLDEIKIGTSYLKHDAVQKIF
jgi:hypothetical protein